MKPLKIGVVGVGSMGANHCRVLQMLKSADFVGVYDINQMKCEQIAAKHQVQPFLSYEDLLKAVDAVIVAAPSLTHYVLTEQAILRGKHVLVEKPFVPSLEEAKQLIHLMEKKQVILQVGHIERFNPAVQLLSEVLHPQKMISLEARRLGAPQRNMDVDVILDLMIHDIDIILHLVKSKIKRMSAAGVSLFHERQLDIASALLSFENGMIANLVASRISQEKIRTLEITESERYIKTNYLTRELYVYRKTNSLLTENSSYHQESIVEKILVPYVEPLFAEVEHFIQSAQTHQPPKAGPHEAMKALEAALKIKECIRTN
ncbi:Gfo/Idh/MocA family oxidoreductase [Microaerobacter geothermalis]|uniref:Gfo/Idh/MocA family protein n=1 Tax=Microaerobacter geothermalis TaxID=674972 RepID=UPI001F28A7D5|nr:Gfo/Idh/MocA family oxidoreductase [Microaerobacter geothermalis]MCF6093308.1 Gfo/Idh/MocA family oxidoreductase [Microaerobacter geothermalis]